MCCGSCEWWALLPSHPLVAMYVLYLVMHVFLLEWRVSLCLVWFGNPQLPLSFTATCSVMMAVWYFLLSGYRRTLWHTCAYILHFYVHCRDTIDQWRCPSKQVTSLATKDVWAFSWCACVPHSRQSRLSDASIYSSKGMYVDWSIVRGGVKMESRSVGGEVCMYVQCMYYRRMSYSNVAILWVCSSAHCLVVREGESLGAVKMSLSLLLSLSVLD